VDAISLLGVIGGVFGILSLIAGAAVYLRASYAKARIDALNGEIEEAARRETVMRTELSDARTRLKVLEAKNAALEELVTQRAQLEGLKESITLMRTEMHADIKELTRLVNGR
jgi:predicted  nucleic acid-binding Zn-ribbon protein